MTDSFGKRLLSWFERYGRKDLPWQLDPTPYRVWVSEIMLQQTQVQTVIPYFERFMQRFPSVRAVAEAPIDEVLHHWSGLGYYARARNLTKAAKLLHAKYCGQFPDDLQALASLPGVGRSTAGAIRSLAFGQREPILDGNVKRVLARHRGIVGYPGVSAVARTLWSAADECMPHERVGAYTQAIMDLGATVCIRTRPLCAACPVGADCVARREDRQAELPTRKPKRELARKFTTFLIVQNADGEVLLYRRPPAGIWGGLWSFPEASHPLDPAQLTEVCKRQLGLSVTSPEALTPLAHGFTHYRLDIHPVRLRLARGEHGPVRMEDRESLWYNPHSPEPLGLAAPVRTLLEALAQNHPASIAT